jgi:protein-disulfide isomerase/uncharacterized membrane protein
MENSLTLNGARWPRLLSFLSGIGMLVFSGLTIQHFYAANFPTSIFQGSFCDISTFFNCDSSAYSEISEVGGVPLGVFGVLVGALVALGAVFPSASFERTNKSISLVNAIGVVVLLLYSVLGLGSLCLLCTGFYAFALVSCYLFWRYGIDRDRGFPGSWLRPSGKHLATYGVVLFVISSSFARYTEARQEAQSGGVAARAVKEFYSLEVVEWPSFISPFWTARATERFEDAPIRIVEYADLLCSDCLFLHQQLQRLEKDFEGQINLAFQFFPLEAECNDVVEKDLHPGACDLSYAAAYDPDKFLAIHEEIFANFEQARRQENWRAALPGRFGVEAALTDQETIDLVQRMIQTGKEYRKTHEKYAHGIRSTPTMIINGRLVIGTLPYEQLHAIFQALVDEQETGDRRFMESWVE